MPTYFREAMDKALEARNFLRFVRFQMDQLSGLNYQPDLFSDALTRFEQVCFDKDFFVPDTVMEMMRNLRTWQPGNLSGRYSVRLFRDALRLSWLEVLSLYGTHMRAPAIIHLCIDSASQPSSLWDMLHGDGEKHDWKMLTHTGPLLSLPPLPQSGYVPISLSPQKVVFTLLHDRRVLLSGMGGIGKTELMRQTSLLLRGNGQFDAVACLSLEGGFEDAISQAFPDLKDLNAQELPDRAAKQLAENGQHVLVLLDHVPDDPMDDPLLSKFLSLLDGAHLPILATGRLTTLPGFVTMTVPLLTDDEARSLFEIHAGNQAEDDAVQNVLRFASGHPMMVTLLGRLCRTNYWSSGELLTRLQQEGLQHLQLLKEGHATDLSVFLKSLFHMSTLPEEDLLLMRFLSIFPGKPWKPGDLEQLAPDLASGRPLALRMEALCEKSLLERGTDGYMMYPLIREAISSEPVSCDEFPIFWQEMAKRLVPPMTPEKQEMYELVLPALMSCKDLLNLDGMHVMRALELTAMTRSSLLSRDLPALHEKYLMAHDHTQMDEAELHIIRMLWALLGKDYDFVASADTLLTLPREVLVDSPCFDVLCNVLEVGGAQLDRNKLDELFRKIDPGTEDTKKRILYLNFLGGKTRSVDKNPDLALSLLQEASELIARNLDTGSVEEAANKTRIAYCLADLGRWRETLPLMQWVLENLKSRGYAEDSQTMVATRSAYDFFRGKCSDLQTSMETLEESIQEMRSGQQVSSVEYVFSLQQLADLYLEDGNTEKAEATIRDALSLRDQLPKENDVTRINLILRAARILAASGKYAEALGYITEYEVIEARYYGAEAPDRQRATLLKEEILKKMGYTGA